MAAKTITAQTPEAQKLQPCLCGAYEVEVGDDAETMEYDSTHCHASTTREFAPGHDAKLKSLLIRAGVAGRSVRINQGGAVYVTDAETAAAKLPFGYMILNGIKRGQARAETKAAKPARTRKAAKKAQPAEVPARIKVGRWEYDGTIDTATNVAAYTSKGQVKTAQPGKYTIVDAK